MQQEWTNIHSVLALSWSPPAPEGKAWLISCNMLHSVDQLVANCVRLLFGAEQIVYSELSLFRWNSLYSTVKLKGSFGLRW